MHVNAPAEAARAEMDRPIKRQDEGIETEQREALADFDEHLPGYTCWVTSCSLMAVSLTPSSHHLHRVSSTWLAAGRLLDARSAVTLH